MMQRSTDNQDMNPDCSERNRCEVNSIDKIDDSPLASRPLSRRSTSGESSQASINKSNDTSMREFFEQLGITDKNILTKYLDNVQREAITIEMLAFLDSSNDNHVKILINYGFNQLTAIAMIKYSQKLEAQKNLLNQNKLVAIENQQISPTSLEKMGQSYKSDLNKFTIEEIETLKKISRAQKSQSNKDINQLCQEFVSVLNNMETLCTLKFHADIYFNLFLKEKNFRLKKIDFNKKTTGVQAGNVLVISYETSNMELKKETFYVKTHGERTKSFGNSKSQMDYREMFLYSLFELISLGPEVHFFFNNKNPNDFYIATKSLGEQFYILPELVLNIDSSKRIYLKDMYYSDPFYDYATDCEFKSKLNRFTEDFKKNKLFIRGLILLDLINKLLNLSDLTTNGDNYGFEIPNEHLKIVDFSVQENKKNQKFNVYENFLSSYSVINKSSFIPLYQFINENKELKLSVAKDIVLNELSHFKTKIDKAMCLTCDFLEKNASNLFSNVENKTNVLNDLNIYVENILESFDEFLKALN